VVGKSRVRLALDWYAKFFRLRDRDSHTVEFRGKSFELDTRPHHGISIDGEVLARTPVTVKIAADVIEVAVPG
jgi:diacylglycerol kinase family enzyme